MRARERDAVIRHAVRTAGALRPSEEHLLRRLAQFAALDGRLKTATPTRKLVERLRLGQSTIERARRRLVAQGLIELMAGGTGRQSYHYRLVLTPALAADLQDLRRYPQPSVWSRKTQGLTRLYREPRARRDPPEVQLHPSPTAAPRGSCAKHAQKPKRGCRACGTSRRQLGSNPRASGTNRRAGYVTPIPPPYAAATHVAAPPPTELLATVRDALRHRRSTCPA